SAAGMFVELTLAAMATFLWWYSQPGVFNSLCLNVMLVCSLSTLLFNGNPLLRYDGYFILSDLMEVPNLQKQSSDVIRQTLSRWFLDLSPRDPLPTPDIRPYWLGLYGLAATAYRWVVLASILWFMYQALKPHGLAIVAELGGAFVACGWFAAPLAAAAAFARDPWRAQGANWPRAILLTTFLGAFLAALAVIPLPYGIYAPVVLEPVDASRVYVTSPGSLVEVRQPGEQVQANDIVARLEDRDLDRDVLRLSSEHARQQLHLQHLERRRVQDPAAAAEIPTAREALDDLRQRLTQRQEDLDRLLLRAPAAGTILPPHDRQSGTPAGELPSWTGSPLEPRNLGCYLQTGDVVCLVGEPGRMQAVLLVDQADVEFVAPGQPVRLLMDQYPQQTLYGTVRDLARIDLKVAPRELVAEKELPVRTDAQGISRPVQAAYQVRVALDDHNLPLLHGAIGRARIRSSPQSAAQRLWRALSRTFRIDL
ncbi:MAG: efflux RND transporter periplasmic adaptor subunit, partial [Pirellulales bacterium]